MIQLDTPGGLVSATRDIIQHILASPIPVIVFVSPGGARAASAGTFIVYAAHVAAMAPGTNVGAATPIELGGLPGLPRPAEPKRDENDKTTAPTETTAQRKALNDTIAMLRSLAQLRGRNVEWSEKAVRDAATLTAEDALKEGVIDVVARDIDELLSKIEGRKLTINSVEHTIATRGVARTVFEPDRQTRLPDISLHLFDVFCTTDRSVAPALRRSPRNCEVLVPRQQKAATPARAADRATEHALQQST